MARSRYLCTLFYFLMIKGAGLIFWTKEGICINKLRFSHSQVMKTDCFLIARKRLEDAEDFIGERDLVIKYLIEEKDIFYTLFRLASALAVFFSMTTIIVWVIQTISLLVIIILFITLIFYYLTFKSRNRYLVVECSIDLVKTVYESKIKKSYNF